MSKITKEQLKLAAVSSTTALTMDRSMFDSAEGELFAGLNIIKLEVGAAAGLFVFKELTPPRFLNDKFKKPIQTGVVQKCDKNGVPSGPDWALPASASMTQKVFDAKIAPGDVFAIARENDYTSKQGREDCKAYIVKVFKRSGEAAVKPATEAEFKQAVADYAKKKKEQEKKGD